MPLKLNRRRFIGACGCSAALQIGSANSVLSEEEDTSFICSAYPFDDDEIDVQPFSAEEIQADETSAALLATIPYGVATVGKRWRRKHGMTPYTDKITLGCFFYNGSNQQQKQLEELAMGWLDGGLEKKMDFRFGVQKEDAEIRIKFDASGANNSLIGTDCLNEAYKEQDKATMNIRDMRSVKHEFGHALCLRHEHRHENFPLTFKEQVIIDEMAKPPNGWGKTKTLQNIINPLLGQKCKGDPAFNADSVMIYSIPRRWNEEKKRLQPNRDISDRDRSCVNAIYGV